MRLLLFLIDETRYAIRADAVVEIVRAVAVTPLPNAPAVVEGIIDVRGSIVPVFDLRRRFHLPLRELSPTDHFVIVRASTRQAAMHVDRVLDLENVDESSVSRVTDRVLRADYVAGVATTADGLAVIHDVDEFLSAAEAESLDAALAESAGAGRTE